MPSATIRMQFASAISDRSHGDEAIKQVTDELAAKLSEPVDLAVVFVTPQRIAARFLLTIASERSRNRQCW